MSGNPIVWGNCHSDAAPYWMDEKDQLSIWRDRSFQGCSDATHFGFVYQGMATLKCAQGEFQLKQGMYFVVPGSCEIACGAGFVVSRAKYQGLFHLGGPIEAMGRLNYINGCSDTLLVSPLQLGDPCFNFLYVPPGVDQEKHTHPSVRIGLVVDGEGICHSEGVDFRLSTGQIFILPPDNVHAFRTAVHHLRIVVYHPDSDFGPTHDVHPMLNRTILGEGSTATPTSTH